MMNLRKSKSSPVHQQMFQEQSHHNIVYPGRFDRNIEDDFSYS